jgi:hypothetical protein
MPRRLFLFARKEKGKKKKKEIGTLNGGPATRGASKKARTH